MSQKRDASGVGPKGGAEIRIYEEKPGDVPLMDLVNSLKLPDRIAILASMEALRSHGHLMRPPHNEHLGNQLYYLRVNGQDGTYRIFYWPYGKGIVILGHGFSKKSRQCPPQEIKRAERMRERFRADPVAHTFEGDIDAQEEDD